MVNPAAAGGEYYQWRDQDLLLRILVQPKAANNEIAGPYGDELKIRIKAAPVDGQANQQLVKFLAKTFKVSKSQIRILSGESGRHKRVRVYAPKQLPNGIEPART